MLCWHYGIGSSGCVDQAKLVKLFNAGRHGVANCGVFEHYRSSAGGEIFFKNWPSKDNLISNTFKLADTITVKASCECIGFDCDNHSVYTGVRHYRNGWYDVPNVSFSFYIGTIHLYN